MANQVATIAQQRGKVTARIVQHKKAAYKPTHRAYILKPARKALAKNEFAIFCVRYKLMVGRAGLS